MLENIHSLRLQSEKQVSDEHSLTETLLQKGTLLKKQCLEGIKKQWTCKFTKREKDQSCLNLSTMIIITSLFKFLYSSQKWRSCYNVKQLWAPEFNLGEKTIKQRIETRKQMYPCIYTNSMINENQLKKGNSPLQSTTSGQRTSCNMLN